MQVFRVDDMTCGHCARTITQAVQAVDANARVTVDLARRLVTVEGARAGGVQALADAMAGAGYNAVPVQGPAREPSVQRKGGCCCGTGGAACGA